MAKTLIFPIVLLFGFFWVFWPVWHHLVMSWSQAEEYSHGFLILPVALYVIYRKRTKLAAIPLAPSCWSLTVVVSALLIFQIALMAGIQTVAALSMIFFIGGTILYLYGYGIFHELGFPLFLLFFMIPIPSQIYAEATVPLQLLVTQVSVAAVKMLNIPVLREGNVIHLPEHTLQVVQACSGLRSMVSLVTLGAILGYLTISSNRLRGLLMAIGVPAAVLANIIRVIVMLLTAYYFQLDLSIGTAHTLFGVFIFLIALLFLIGTKGFLTRWDTCCPTEE